MKHTNSHVDGVFSGSVPAGALSSFAALGYSPCPQCSRFFKSVSIHLPSCRSVPSSSSAPPAASVSAPNDPNFLVSLQDVFTGFRPTLTFVPVAHRQSWGRVVTAAIEQVLNANSANASVEAWTRLLMLPKCVLTTPKRAGKRNRGDNLSVTDLCKAWEAGQVEWLWTRSFRSHRQSAKQSVDSQRVFSAAIQHARHGRLGKACSTLSSGGLAPNDDATVDKLRQKHPVHPPPDLVPLPHAPPLELKQEFDLLGALASFAKNVGTDSTNFRVQHLLDAHDAHLPKPFLPKLRALVNLL